MTSLLLRRPVIEAIRSVDDPEYPGVSIMDLGLLELLTITNADVEIGLIPTFSGCPALAFIAADVEDAVRNVEGVELVDVKWMTAPVWTTKRISAEGRERLADEFTVAVQIGDVTPQCPRCGQPTTEQSMFGPSRCRAVHRCDSCVELVEVVRN